MANSIVIFDREQLGRGEGKEKIINDKVNLNSPNISHPPYLSKLMTPIECKFF
jgi:hypothetical protein